MNLEQIRAEIERMRHQISRQRKDIQSLQRADISTLATEALLAACKPPSTIYVPNGTNVSASSG
jgi:hypothetical protein